MDPVKGESSAGVRRGTAVCPIGRTDALTAGPRGTFDFLKSDTVRVVSRPVNASTTTPTTGARMVFDPGFAILTNAPTRRF